MTNSAWDKLANKAWYQVRKQVTILSDLDRAAKVVPPDAKYAIVEYLKEAYDIMKEKGNGYDPYVHGPVTAQRVAVIYAKNVYLGNDPEADQRYLMAFRGWLKTAAKS